MIINIRSLTGAWANVKHWFMMGITREEEALLEDSKKVPSYLNITIHYFSDIFGVSNVSIS